jgi:hypothetical protein
MVGLNFCIDQIVSCRGCEHLGLGSMSPKTTVSSRQRSWQAATRFRGNDHCNEGTSASGVLLRIRCSRLAGVTRLIASPGEAAVGGQRRGPAARHPDREAPLASASASVPSQRRRQAHVRPFTERLAETFTRSVGDAAHLVSLRGQR